MAKLLRMPVIFAVAGAVMISQSAHQLPPGWHLGAMDAVVIGFELVVALAAGWWMGRLTQIRTIDGTVSSRLGRGGVAVWIGFLALRISLDLSASAISAPLAALPATIFFVIAAIKIVQAVIIRERVARHRSAGLAPVQPLAEATQR
jgi:hypothetical protein